MARQVEHARQYAQRKSWTVADEHVYLDDGISGAEFTNRPGFLRLMSALKPRPPFQVLIMSEESRLGREAIETAYALKQLVTAGVRLFFYLEDRERTLNSPIEKAMLALQTMSDEMEREKARHRTYDAMLRKAKAGHVAGGRVFGYDNVTIVGPSGKRSHVERRINDAEAAVIRRIFDLSAAGNGFTRIAKMLNAEHAPAPRPQQQRPAGWSPSTVKEILDQRIYVGELVWNRTRKRNEWGQKKTAMRPDGEWIRHSVPALRIVSDTVWQAAHARLAGIKAQLIKAIPGGQLGGRHTRDVESNYLLSGFARCAMCGGTLSVMSRNHGRQRAFFYGCLAHHKRGAVCRNSLLQRLECVDEAVLRTLAGDIVRPAVIMAIVEGVLEQLKPPTIARGLDRLRTELQTVERGISNLTKAIAATGPLDALLTGIKASQARRDELRDTITARVDRCPTIRPQADRAGRPHAARALADIAHDARARRTSGATRNPHRAHSLYT